MPLTEFNVVLVGESFPISSIRVSDFTYRGRDLKEVLRVPVVIQAENELVAVHIMPDRFQAAVKSPDRLQIQCEGLNELVTTFLEYVGKRTVKGVGHNARWTIPGTRSSRAALSRMLLDAHSVEAIVGAEVLADISLQIEGPHGSKGRIGIPTTVDADVTLDFNFHFETPALGEPSIAAAWLSESLDRVAELSALIETRLEALHV